jgi:hypothetical protein
MKTIDCGGKSNCKGVINRLRKEFTNKKYQIPKIGEKESVGKINI